jgi:putative tryptophan/tyrosine transport system substrate-binding protein
MRRREFIVLLGSTAAVWARAARAEKTYRIVILHSGFPRRTPIDHLFDALRERGYEDGRTAKIELLGGEGDPERLKALIADIVSQKPDVTIAVTSPAALGLKRAGLLTPVVFAFVSDPVGQGIVASLAHPGGNFTGISYSETKIGSKRLEFLLGAVPAARRAAIIWGAGFPENVAMANAVEAAAQARSLPAFSRKVTQLNDLTPAFEDAARFGATALIFLTDNLLFGHRKEISELALSHHLPSIHSFPPEVRDGALMSYGPDVEEEYQRAAALADRILKGASPADLPVEEPTRFNLVINIKTAKAFGLSVPPTLLAIADEVIE